MRSRRALLIVGALASILLLAAAVSQLPAVKSRLEWRYIVWSTYLQNAIDPVGPMPTPAPSTPFATFTPEAPTPTSVAAVATAAPTATVAPPPAAASLPSPTYERQGINNCGPATLTMALRMYGWTGTQDDITPWIKPLPQDRNVNPDELRWFVLNKAGWLRADYWVAGDVETLKRLLAANFPVVIEEASKLPPEDANGPRDDLWDAHYILITAYDDATSSFTYQDPLRGPDRKVTYDQLMVDWKPFNYLYMVIWPDPGTNPQPEQDLKTILGSNWDVDQNRRNALDIDEKMAAANPNDAFAWFDLGATLTYFQRYQEAVQAFDKAFTIGLPQRMTRYQFWPFVAYYNADRLDYLIQLTENTYKPINGNYAEEALLWHGYALLRKSDATSALADWNRALVVHPQFCDAERAINNFIQPTYPNVDGTCSP